MSFSSIELWVGLSVALAVTPLLVRVALRSGWTDDPSSAPERKLQPRPVPPVGGAALLIALVAARVAGFAHEGFAHELAMWTAFALAFATGLVDDLKHGGLRPGAKLVGQSLAGIAFGCAAVGRFDLPPIAAAAFLAVLAQNLVNTWDNADGAATALGACGLVVGPAFGLGAVLGFLPHNLFVRRGATPSAYLGDSGSHLLALVLLSAPASGAASWPGPSAVLWLPLLDLARLSCVRLRAGSRPWIGDRRHLAHRLAATGLGPVGVSAVLVALTAPLVAGGIEPEWLGYGLLASTASYAWVLVRTAPSRRRPASRRSG